MTAEDGREPESDPPSRRGICSRCGGFLIGDAPSRLTDECEPCRSGRGLARMAWEAEETNRLARWWATTVDVFLRPSVTFDAVDPGSPWRAITYAGLTGVVYGSIRLGLFLLGAEATSFSDVTQMIVAQGASLEMATTMLGIALCLWVAWAGVRQVLFVFVLGALFHLPVALGSAFGDKKRRSFATSIWAVSYLSALFLAHLPIAMLDRVSGSLVLLAASAGAAWWSLLLTRIARRHHVLTPRKASVAGWFHFTLAGLAITFWMTASWFVT